MCWCGILYSKTLAIRTKRKVGQTKGAISLSFPNGHMTEMIDDQKHLLLIFSAQLIRDEVSTHPLFFCFWLDVPSIHDRSIGLYAFSVQNISPSSMETEGDNLGIPDFLRNGDSHCPSLKSRTARLEARNYLPLSWFPTHFQHTNNLHSPTKWSQLTGTMLHQASRLWRESRKIARRAT